MIETSQRSAAVVNAAPLNKYLPRSRTRAATVCRDPAPGHCYFFFGTATIMSSSTRAPGEESWLMHTVVEAGSQSPK